jgi:hypothetical protein
MEKTTPTNTCTVAVHGFVTGSSNYLNAVHWRIELTPVSFMNMTGIHFIGMLSS